VSLNWRKIFSKDFYGRFDGMLRHRRQDASRAITASLGILRSENSMKSNLRAGLGPIQLRRRLNLSRAVRRGHYVRVSSNPVPATTFIITHLPSRSNHRRGFGLSEERTGRVTG
jgi:hypothetical protein